MLDCITAHNTIATAKIPNIVSFLLLIYKTPNIY
jgi:hypothetical protein